MEKNRETVLLGFEDEHISEKYKNQVNFCTNKIGGKPDYPPNIKLDPPICGLCQLPRPLIVQIYAPLEHSVYHRTLYLFACINPNCWNLNESWYCIRVHSQETTLESEETISSKSTSVVTHWCDDADDWDDDNNTNFNEENGNVISNIEKVSDEDDESCSLEDSLRSGFGNLFVDDRNANKGAQGGAVGRLHSPSATAEIEGNEGEVISIDTPTFPQRDIASLLQEAAPLPQDICQSDSRRISSIQFSPYFMAVWEETPDKQLANVSDRHVKELLQDYQQKNDDNSYLLSPEGGVTEGGEGYEKYEKSNPAHGDKMFHQFLSKIQSNPGQILRYSRESSPILLYPLQETMKKCQYCQGDLVFEFQILSTIISKLKLSTDPKQIARLEFGTVLVYTCRKSCWSSDTIFRTETVILQKELY
ncbi:programmed cell death protein 2-like [Diorhabda carinulata]|uniref:programmed cell death protein 2-like n=1 Tax=Diorhabda carinulata TaxID=1163345 RepID=UPI0025A0AA8D|nr:programmed cell death protein 2-like [Diorhabda carinulata]